MFGYSLIRTAHIWEAKIDKSLRSHLIDMYRPFRWIPSFMHSITERIMKKVRKFPVVIEFHEGKEPYQAGIKKLRQVASEHKRSSVQYEFASVSCCSAELTANAIEQLLQENQHIKKMHGDRKVTVFLDIASPSLHTDILNYSGLTGEGVTIAIVDTGIYPHPDLIRPTNRIVAFQDFVNHRTSPYDDNGHGTHCAGDAAGNGYAFKGKYKGPAPNAKLVGVKVLDRTGSGSLSAVMAGVQWCIEHKAAYGIDIISMSLGSQAVQSAETDPMVKMVEKAWDSGIVVCVAAGNEGPDSKTIASPGTSKKVITVGAMKDQNTIGRSDDTLAEFSSRGPTVDGWVKPDLLTPGVNIISLRSPRSYLDKQYKSNRVGNHYFSLSGTSMATPICAGVAALVLQKYKGLSPDEVKQKLLDGAEDWGLPPNVQGKGYLNAQKAGADA